MTQPSFMTRIILKYEAAHGWPCADLSHDGPPANIGDRWTIGDVAYTVISVPRPGRVEFDRPLEAAIAAGDAVEIRPLEAAIAAGDTVEPPASGFTEDGPNVFVQFNEDPNGIPYKITMERVDGGWKTRLDILAGITHLKDLGE